MNNGDLTLGIDGNRFIDGQWPIFSIHFFRIFKKSKISQIKNLRYLRNLWLLFFFQQITLKFRCSKLTQIVQLKPITTLKMQLSAMAESFHDFARSPYFMNTPRSQNRCNFAFRKHFLCLMTIPTAQSGFKINGKSGFIQKFWRDDLMSCP